MRERVDPSPHEKLYLLGDRLRAIAACPVELIPRRRWRRLIRGDFAVFAATLSDHLRDEEDSGFFDEIARATPALARRVDKLRAQHDELRAQLETIMGSIDDLRDTDSVRSSIRTLLDSLETHEQLESEAVQDAHLRDVGGLG